MARSVSGIFADKQQVDSAYGALRDAGFETARINVVSPDGTTIGMVDKPAGQGLGHWLVDHLVRHGHPHTQAHELHDQVASGHWLVTVSVQTDIEDGDARNLMVSTGATQISSVADGTMIAIQRPGSAV